MLDFGNGGTLSANALAPRLLRRGVRVLPATLGPGLGPRQAWDERLPIPPSPQSSVNHSVDGEMGNRERTDYLSGRSNLGPGLLPLERPGLSGSTLTPVQVPGGVERGNLNAGLEAATLGPKTLSPTLAPGSSGMPTIARPTAAESKAAGRAEYAADMPQITARVGTPQYFQQKASRLEYQQEHPWGSPISSHPGRMGKFLHGLATLGNVAGDILVPRVMAEVPGTGLSRRIQLGNDLRLGQQAEQAQQRRELNTARLSQIGAETAADNARLQAEQQRYANLRLNPRDRFLWHDTDASGNSVAVFEGKDGIYSVPAGYQPKGKTGTGGNHSDFSSYWQSLVAAGMPDTPQNRLKARKDWDAAGRKPGGAGAKPPTIEAAGAKRSRFATAKDRIQAQIANLNDQQARLGQGQGWRPAAQQKLAALQDEYRQASEQYDYWNGIYNMVVVQIPGHPVGHIPRSQLARFKKVHPNAKVLSQ